MENDLILGMGLVALATLIGSGGALFFKKVSKDVNRNIFGLLKKPLLYVGFILYGVSALVFVFGLKFGELSALYPVAGLSYIWISLLSIKFLGEKMNDYKWFGVGLIIVGVVLVGLSA